MRGVYVELISRSEKKLPLDSNPSPVQRLIKLHLGFTLIRCLTYTWTGRHKRSVEQTFAQSKASTAATASNPRAGMLGTGLQH